MRPRRDRLKTTDVRLSPDTEDLAYSRAETDWTTSPDACDAVSRVHARVSRIILAPLLACVCRERCQADAADTFFSCCLSAAMMGLNAERASSRRGPSPMRGGGPIRRHQPITLNTRGSPIASFTAWFRRLGKNG